MGANYPMTDVCAWLGNSPQVAPDHYMQAMAESFERAAVFGAAGNAQSDARRRSIRPTTGDRDGRKRRNPLRMRRLVVCCLR